MNTKIGPSLLVVIFGVLSIVIASLGSIGPQGQWVNHGIATVLAAGLLAMVAYFRRWKKFAWTPVVGMAIASIGVVADLALVITIGYGLTVIMSLWHNYQAEQPTPAENVTSS